MPGLGGGGDGAAHSLTALRVGRVRYQRTAAGHALVVLTPIIRNFEYSNIQNHNYCY